MDFRNEWFWCGWYFNGSHNQCFQMSKCLRVRSWRWKKKVRIIIFKGELQVARAALCFHNIFFKIIVVFNIKNMMEDYNNHEQRPGIIINMFCILVYRNWNEYAYHRKYQTNFPRQCQRYIDFFPSECRSKDIFQRNEWVKTSIHILEVKLKW